MLRLLSDAKPPAGLQSTVGQPNPMLPRTGEKSSLSADQNDSKPAENAADRVVGHRGKEGQTGYKVRWYGYSPEDNTYESAPELPINLVRRY